MISCSGSLMVKRRSMDKEDRVSNLGVGISFFSGGGFHFRKERNLPR